MQSGRAVIFPIKKGTYQRNFGSPPPDGGSAERDLVIAWAKDLNRSIDYLENRPDIDTKRLAYYGFSLGAFYGPIFTEVDHRFAVSVLAAGGLSPNFPLPEVDAVHYLHRNHTPTLLIAGRGDYIVPVETHQKPLIRLLAAAPKDKRHVILDSGHMLFPYSIHHSSVIITPYAALSNPRSAASSSATRSDNSHNRSVTPAAMAGLSSSLPKPRRAEARRRLKPG